MTEITYSQNLFIWTNFIVYNYIVYLLTVIVIENECSTIARKEIRDALGITIQSRLTIQSQCGIKQFSGFVLLSTLDLYTWLGLAYAIFECFPGHCSFLLCYVCMQKEHNFNQIEIEALGELETYELLAILDFDSLRKRMSVCVGWLIVV